MDIQNSNGKNIQGDESVKFNLDFSLLFLIRFISTISVSLPINIAQEQYVFTDRFNTFDPNMCSTAEYSPPSNAQQTNAIAPFHNIAASSYDEQTEQNSDISLVRASDVTNNCITYSNVIFVPTIANNGNQLNHMHGNTIELVKHASNGHGVEVNDSQSFKYIVSSEPHFVNTFVPTNDIDGTTPALETVSTQAYIEPQSSHMITTVSRIDDNNLILNGISNETNQIHQQLNNDPNHIGVQMHTGISSSGNDQDVLMQDENGQLYRQVQNILINGTSMCPSDLLPILSAPVDLADPEYVEQSISRIQSTYNQRDNGMHDMPFQIPVNFVSNAESTESLPVASKAMDTNLDLQQVEFIYNSYRNTNMNQNDANQYEQSRIHDYGTETVSSILNENTNYQSSNDSSNQQRNPLESTMSSLCK